MMRRVARRLWQRFVFALLVRALTRIADVRQPDLVIGETHRPYLRRWYVWPRNRWCNLYLHQILRSDDDRALHDHPWWNASLILAGIYIEHTIAAGGVHRRTPRDAGTLVVRGARRAHRLEVPELSWLPPDCDRDGGVWTLFLTGPRLRAWGFHCPGGWRAWQDFTAGDHGERIGRGCDG